MGLGRISLKVRLQKALGKLLEPRIRMRNTPSRDTTIIFQDSVRNRQMLPLKNIVHMEPIRTLLTHNEPDCVCSSLSG